jgi:di/tricarboxylate transporter
MVRPNPALPGRQVTAETPPDFVPHEEIEPGPSHERHDEIRRVSLASVASKSEAEAHSGKARGHAMQALIAAKRIFRKKLGIILFVVFGAIVYALLGTLSFSPLSWKGWYALVVLLLLFAGLMEETYEPHVCMLTAGVAFLTAKIIDFRLALEGFSNEGVATVAALFIVAEGISQTGVLLPIFSLLLGRPRFLWEALLRLLIPVGLISGFLNNTPVVAFMIPVVLRWCSRSRFAPAKFMMPLNDVTALGGTLTLIGTSTNLVVKGLAEKDNIGVKLTIFGPTPIGAVVLAAGIVYLAVFSKWLPVRGSALDKVTENPRNYTVALRVMPKSEIVGETIESAGLRHLGGLFLIEITREDGVIVPAPDSETKVCTGDTMVFAGDVDTVTELYHIQGLVPATAQTDKVGVVRHQRRLVEVVISPSASALVGHTVRESLFRTRFGAAIIAVHRGTEHVTGRIGDVVLRGGDALLLETNSNFSALYRKDSNFALVSEVAGSQPPRGDYLHMFIAGVCVVTMITLATANVTTLLTASCCVILIFLVTGCMSLEVASTAVNVPVMLTVAGSFAVANGLSKSGAAAEIAKFIVTVFKGAGKTGLVVGIYLSTALIGAIVTNNAAVALMFPIVANPTTGIIATANLNPYAGLYAMMFAASADFSTPIGAQTNMMCHAPGGYKFTDWILFGVPLQVVTLVVTIVMLAILHKNPA